MENFNNKVVIVTGATGLIGSNLVHALLTYGAKVIAIGRNKAKLDNTFDDDTNLIKLEHDIVHEKLSQYWNIDYVFHAASPISGYEIKNHPVDVINANMDGLLNCIDYLERQKKRTNKNGRLIIFSSATVYGIAKDCDLIVSEDDTKKCEDIKSPIAAYAESKRMIEVMAGAYKKQLDIDYIVARIGYVYGYSKYLPQTAFYEFIKKAVKGEDISINNPTMPRRDNIYIDDVVNGLLCISQKGISGEAYNISSGGMYNNFSAIDEMTKIIIEVVQEIKGECLSNLYIKESVEERLSGIMMNNDKLKILGWNLKYSMRDGILETVKRYCKNNE